MACPPGGSRLLLIGDSLAVGLEPRLIKKASACATPFAAVVKGGTGVLHWRPRIEALLAEHQPSAIIISLGGNDYWRMEGDPGQGGAAVRAAIPELVSAIRAARVVPLWIRWLIPIPDRPGVDAAWRATGVSYYDTEPLQIPRPRGDPYHPTPEGFDRLADGLWDWTASELTEPGGQQPVPERPTSPRSRLGPLAAAAGFGVGFWVGRAIGG